VSGTDLTFIHRVTNRFLDSFYAVLSDLNL
jgi:hypothetical protein